jgi:hypothetical protein
LTGHIAREARRIAATKAGGRLDPPLRLALDEAALICPVPLESWTADMGGRGVTILCVVQSRAQLLARYGEHGAATILNNAGAVMVFGGTRDRDDLQFWSTLAGDRDEPAETSDLHGRTTSRTSRKTPVVGRAQMAWRRPDTRWTGFTRRRPGLAGRIARLVARLPGVRTGVVRAVPGWPGPALDVPPAARGAGEDDATLLQGQAHDTNTDTDTDTASEPDDAAQRQAVEVTSTAGRTR